MSGSRARPWTCLPAWSPSSSPPPPGRRHRRRRLPGTARTDQVLHQGEPRRAGPEAGIDRPRPPHLRALFQGEELTVGRLTQRCRLAKCREELGRGGPSGPGVSVIAERWGFAHPTRFTRAFRTAYGMTPSEWQAAARDADATDCPRLTQIRQWSFPFLV
ncbi:helix-turn-helix domain-containing protein [Streptomyces sparsogenes]|uniref:helix-turn-helix domain-containing protein n=1 Tax=Streptomyces sparsogenes TaxID=67365 RepID=UPI0033ECAD71